MPLRVTLSGTPRRVKVASVKAGGEWKPLKQIFVKKDGDWKPIWQYNWNTGPWSGCSASCGGGTKTRSVWCERDDGLVVDDALCTSSKPSTSTSCNTHACQECRSYNSNHGAHIRTGAATMYLGAHSGSPGEISTRFHWDAQKRASENGCWGYHDAWEMVCREVIIDPNGSTTEATNTATAKFVCPHTTITVNHDLWWSAWNNLLNHIAVKRAKNGYYWWGNGDGWNKRDHYWGKFYACGICRKPV